MESEIIEAWTQARARGETVALMANSNEAVRRLNRLAQQTRILNGEISVRAGAARLGEEVICVGDQVVTRRNDRTLRTDGGHMVKNRDRWTIDTIHPDRSITLTGDTGTIRIPADYAAADLELGYAQTSHTRPHGRHGLTTRRPGYRPRQEPRRTPCLRRHRGQSVGFGCAQSGGGPRVDRPTRVFPP